MIGTLRPSLSVIVALVALWCSNGVLEAQNLKNSAFLGVGYVTNFPNTFVGFSGLVFTPEVLGGAGVYADVKFSVRSPGNDPQFLDGVTPEQAELTFGDLLFGEKGAFLSVNVALVYAVTPELGVYAGAGYTREDHYHEYFDQSETRGEFGFYWVEDRAESGGHVNLLGGLLIRLARPLLFQVGVEREPLGATLGAVLIFPR